MERSKNPTFTVVIATYGRDALIASTLTSVQKQTLADFEVLVVSDGPASESLKTIVSQFDDRFMLHEIQERSRSQSGPNNEGLRLAKGRYIAYLGHDDIWHPEHLERFASVFERNPKVEFAVSGCIYLGPPGREDEQTWISGIFEGSLTKPLETFFPPSSFSHRRDIDELIKKWPEAMATRRPVDCEFLIRAAEANSTFISTGSITLFKFASALRYLSYLQQDDREQREMLELLENEDQIDSFISEKVRVAHENGGFMRFKMPSALHYRPGEKVISNEEVRGIITKEIPELTSKVSLPIAGENRGSDWHPLETQSFNNPISSWLSILRGRRMTWRWSGPSHRPRILIPFQSKGLVKVTLGVSRFATDEIKDSLAVFVNGNKVNHLISLDSSGYWIEFQSHLRSGNASVIELVMIKTIRASELVIGSRDERKIGLCLHQILLEPAN
jgi:glycosyltransferase involved in cell wall biosynthesis